MAVTVTDNKISVNVILDNGDGKTLSVPFPALDKTAFDADKVFTIAGLLFPCFNKTALRIEKIVVSSITQGD